MDISTVSKLVLTEDNPENIKTAGQVESLDTLLQSIKTRFVIKKAPIDVTDSETNTSFDDKENQGEDEEWGSDEKFKTPKKNSFLKPQKC